jgi:hypothetical protein
MIQLSLYRITGDEIALRIQFNPKTGEVMHRHAWPGFVGASLRLPPSWRRSSNMKNESVKLGFRVWQFVDFLQ